MRSPYSDVRRDFHLSAKDVVVVVVNVVAATVHNAQGEINATSSLTIRGSA